MSMRIVRRIPNLPSPQLSFKAVGIYARVSTQRPSQFSSISSQVSALVQQVYHTYQWKLADVYIDFSSGTAAPTLCVKSPGFISATTAARSSKACMLADTFAE